MLAAFKPSLLSFPRRFCPCSRPSLARHHPLPRIPFQSQAFYTNLVRLRRMDQNSIRKYLTVLDGLLTSEKHDEYVMQEISRRFSSKQFKDSARHSAYENILWLLIRHRRFHNACILFERMIDERFMPTSSLRKKMSAVIVYTAIHTSDNPLDALRDGFSQNAFDEDGLKEFIELFPPRAYQPALIVTILKMFIATREPGYHPPPSFCMMLGELSERFGPEFERLAETFDHLKLDTNPDA
jgi:hypothetical protein